MSSTRDRAFLACGLSILVPGLGQIYNRQVLKGIVIFATSFLVLPYVFGVVDAYLVARGRSPLPAFRGPRGLLPAPAPRARDLEVALVREAQRNGGTLSVPQAVAATGRPFREVEKKLDQLLHAGHVDIDNDPQTGVVIYRFL